MAEPDETPVSFGGFVLLKTLGRGATGSVHLARSRSDPDAPFCVVKRLHARHEGEEEFVRRFRHEAELAVAIDSPHVAQVLGAGRVGSSLYIAFEYVRGIPLSRLIEELRASETPPTLEQALTIAETALLGLSAIHEARDPRTGQPLGIVHRDISPKNLMVRRGCDVCLIDLGLGKSRLQDWRTMTGAIMGTAGYMAPEQARGEAADRRADLYSLGVVLFELFTLRPYLERGPLVDMIARAAEPAVRRVRDLRPQIPAAIDDALARALAPDPRARFKSADEFLRALLDAAKQSSTSLSPEALERLLAIQAERDALEESSLREVPLPRLEDPSETEVYARTPIVRRAPARPPAAGPARTPAVLVAVAGLALGLGLGYAATRREAAPTIPVLLPANPVPVVRARSSSSAPEPRIEPASLEPPAPPAPAPPAVASPARPPRPTPPRRPVAAREGAAPEPIEPRLEDPARILERIEAQAATVKLLRPEHKSQVDELLTDAAMDARSTDVERARRRLLLIQARLQSMAEGSGERAP